MNYYIIHTKLKHCRNPKFTYYQVCFSYLFFFYEILLTWWPLAGEVIRASSGQGCQSCKAKAMHTNFYIQESFTFNSGRNSVAGEVTPGAGKKITFSDSFEQAVISLALERVSWVFFACLFVCLLVCFVPSSEENHFHRRLTWKETSWQFFFPPTNSGLRPISPASGPHSKGGWGELQQARAFFSWATQEMLWLVSGSSEFTSHFLNRAEPISLIKQPQLAGCLCNFLNGNYYC